MLIIPNKPNAPPNVNKAVEKKRNTEAGKGNKDASVIEKGWEDAESFEARVWLRLIKKLKQRNATARAE